jgi:hypothetical protein
LSGSIDTRGPAASYLDFEAFLPAIPLYPGTKPYQTIPFQWSLCRNTGASLSPEGIRALCAAPVC